MLLSKKTADSGRQWAVSQSALSAADVQSTWRLCVSSETSLPFCLTGSQRSYFGETEHSDTDSSETGSVFTDKL